MDAAQKDFPETEFEYAAQSPQVNRQIMATDDQVQKPAAKAQRTRHRRILCMASTLEMMLGQLVWSTAGRNGPDHPDPMFHPQTEHQLSLEVPAEDLLGTEKSGRLVSGDESRSRGPSVARPLFWTAMMHGPGQCVGSGARPFPSLD